MLSPRKFLPILSWAPGYQRTDLRSDLAAGVTVGAMPLPLPHLVPIVEPICEIARQMPDASVDEIVRHNVAATINALAEHSGPVGAASRNGQLEIRGAVHGLLSGHLEPIDPQPIHPPTITELAA
jgi:carbonic anhydrase